MELYDIAVIGSGPGGYVAAIYAARRGKKVAVIEKGLLGGTCLNRGCIPTKALLSSAAVLEEIKNSSSFGIDISSFSVNFHKVNSRKEEIVKKLRLGIESLFKARGIDLIKGEARFVDKNTLSAAGRSIRANAIIIAAGSSPAEIPAFKFDHKNILSSDDMLQLNEPPKSLLIIGAGAIGCEFAAIYNSFGSKVTLVEQMEEILPNMDREIARRLDLALKKNGVEVMTSVKPEQIKKISADKTLVCAGRRPDFAGLGIEGIGVKTANGRIVADEHMRTSIGNIYAIGDVTGRFQLAHVASYEGIVACENILGEDRKADYTSVPSCVYTEPEIASVGLSEEAAKKSGLDIKISRFLFSALGRAHASSKTDGMIKLIGLKDTGKILGVHIMGAGASSLIAEATLAIKKSLTARELSEAIHAHPTFSEGLMEACFIFNDTGIHVL